jgi:hypothetical protein
MRKGLLSLSIILLCASTAFADHDRDHRAPVVVKEKVVVKPVVVREKVVVQPARVRYTGPVRANRRVIERRPVYISNGAYVFANGHRYTYVRPVIREHYYNRAIRPTVIVENYETVPGYVWIRGGWSWDGREWIWAGGHYEADASIRVYYDDGSWD